MLIQLLVTTSLSKAFICQCGSNGFDDIWVAMLCFSNDAKVVHHAIEKYGS